MAPRRPWDWSFGGYGHGTIMRLSTRRMTLRTSDFSWGNLPPEVLQSLANGLDLTGEPGAAISRAWGPQPSDDLVRAGWSVLRESWLALDAEARERVVTALGGATGAGEMDFLRAKSNAKRLREVVVDVLLDAGRAGSGSPAAPPSSPPPATTRATRATTTTADLSLAELERRLWDAANSLRGPVDPADFKTYVFPMLFWKWISDTWDHEHAQAAGDYGEDIDAEVEADYHRFTLPEGTRWRQVTTKTDNIGSRIGKALGTIEQSNPDRLAGIFGDAAWGNKERLPEASLVALINALSGLDLNPERVPHDVLGQAYEYLLKNFADESGKKAGEFFTPRQVVRLIVKMLDPQPGESTYDPACGSGGMLVETINSVRERGEDTRTLRLYGQEVNLTTAAIARMNLYLHEIEDFKIVRGDTLRSPGLRRPDGAVSRFDVVIANPPFSLANWGGDTWAADPRSFCGMPPMKNGDFAWVQHMVSSMTEDKGRVGVVMPHGVLFRGGVEAKIRQCLIEQDRLEAVVSLPTNLFYSTSIPACVLIFRAAKAVERRQHVLLVDGSRRFTKGRNQNQMTASDVTAIIWAYQTGANPAAEGGVNVRLVPLDEIRANTFDLNIARYLTTGVADNMDLVTALANYEDARAERMTADATLFERLKAAGIANVDGSRG